MTVVASRPPSTRTGDRDNTRRNDSVILARAIVNPPRLGGRSRNRLCFERLSVVRRAGPVSAAQPGPVRQGQKWCQAWLGRLGVRWLEVQAKSSENATSNRFASSPEPRPADPELPNLEP